MMQRSWQSVLLAAANRQRRSLRESEAAFIVLAAIVGLTAGALTNVQQLLAHGIQRLFYGVTINRLSALGEIHHPLRLLALPIGGLVLVLFSRFIQARRRAPVDVVEANALHGGRIPLADNLVIAAQTILSNGVGASVGLEATYAQMGGGFASLLGQWFKLRRADLRTLVGAGAGAAVGAAFGAPLTGAFYAFEIVIGTYTPAAVAPVVAATLSAAFVTRSLGVEPYLIATTNDRVLTIVDYIASSGLGVVCAVLGIAIMRMVTAMEQRVHGWQWLSGWRPVIGGMLLMPIAWLSPQSLSAGHGALHLNLVLHPALTFLLTVLALKIVASIVSLSFGFRGGLFFASLFIGSLIGQIFVGALDLAGLAHGLDSTDGALIGMAGLSVAIVGGPMTLAILVLETTHDFALMGVVLTAALISSALTRELFGYSFSTWRMHVRGSTVRSPRDIGWALDLTAARMMRRDWRELPEHASIAGLREAVPLGSTSKVVLVDAAGGYRGIVSTEEAWRPDLDPDQPVAMLATLQDVTLDPQDQIHTQLARFDEHSADVLAVTDAQRRVLGVVSEKHARRRYFDGIENAQREIFREG